MSHCLHSYYNGEGNHYGDVSYINSVLHRVWLGGSGLHKTDFHSKTTSKLYGDLFYTPKYFPCRMTNKSPYNVMLIPYAGNITEIFFVSILF